MALSNCDLYVENSGVAMLFCFSKVSSGKKLCEV